MVETEQFCVESRSKSSVPEKRAAFALKKRDLLICLSLALVTFVCYWPVTTHDFVSLDDYQYLRDNAHVRTGLSWAGILWSFTTGYACNWHPLTWISHMIDCQLYGLSPGGHHFTNLLFHVLNSVLLFLLFRNMAVSVWRSAFVAALFAWHPLHVESVAWAAERKDVLSTFFFILALWAYGKYAGSQGQSLERKIEAEEDGHSKSGAQLGAHDFEVRHPHSSVQHILSFPAYWLALVFFGLGLMAKPMLVTLPCVLLLLDVWPLRRLQLSRMKSFGQALAPAEISRSRMLPLRELLREKIPFFVLTSVASVITYLVQQAGGAVSSLALAPLHARIGNALLAYVRYIAKAVWPSHLAAVYPYSNHLPLLSVFGSALMLIIATVLCFRASQRRPYLLVGWLWFVGTLVPTIGLIQVGTQSMADRYMYIPGIGLFLMIAWGGKELLERLPQKRACLAVASGAALIGCVACSVVQLRYWQDSKQLFSRAINVTSGNYVAYDCLGNIAEAEGRRSEAMALFSECVRISPTYAEGQYDLGTLLLEQGNLEEASQHLNAALKTQPSFVDAHINLGKVLLQQNRLNEAEAHFAKAAELAPDDPAAEFALGTALLKMRNLDEAVKRFSIAVRLNADYSEAQSNLGVTLMMLGKSTEGLFHLSEAVRLNPGNSEAESNLGLAFLDVKRPEEAAARFAQAVHLEPGLPRNQFYLALALAREAKSAEAMPHAEKARDLARASGQDAFAAKAQSLMDLCEAGQPVPDTF